MTFREAYGLRTIINARGTFTPLGVSRSSPAVARAVGEALSDFYVIDELHDLAGRRLADWAGADAAALLHCTAAAITVSIAAVMAGQSAAKIAALPDTKGMRNKVILPRCHLVHYGHSIEQAIRLSGATPVYAGSEEDCSLADIEAALAEEEVACLLLVSSRLARGSVDLGAAVVAAHAQGVPAIIDGAAQDWRVGVLLASGADAVLVSAQKYLAAPTAGLVIGRSALVAAVRGQEKGIGRGMKASKEAIAGVLAAVAERQAKNAAAWSVGQERKVTIFLKRAGWLRGVVARAVADPTGLPFSRAALQLGSGASIDAEGLARALKAGEPSIWVMDQDAAVGVLTFELVQLTDDEIDVVLTRLSELLD